VDIVTTGTTGGMKNITILYNQVLTITFSLMPVYGNTFYYSNRHECVTDS